MIRKVILGIFTYLFAAIPAAALNLASVPPKFNIPWGNAAGAGFITYPVPQASQIGVTPCAASLTDGFPPLSFQALAAGGCGPRGQDFNGILKQITLWNQWAAAGAILQWDSAFATAISGYPNGALVSQASQAGCYWVNRVDGNTANPDSGGTNWTSACPGGALATAAATGTANAQVVTAKPFLLRTGTVVTFNPQTNTGATTLNVNASGVKTLQRQTPGGAVATSGGELHASEFAQAVYDGTNWKLVTAAATAFLTVADQPLTGGVAPLTDNVPFASTINIDCGIGPLQYLTNTGAVTLNAPVNDSSCFFQVENSATAGAVTAVGFTVGGSQGDPLDTVNGHKFTIHVWNIHGTAAYFVKALQ